MQLDVTNSSMFPNCREIDWMPRRATHFWHRKLGSACHTSH
jgi:hypothetical protein